MRDGWAARDISYAHSARTAAGRALIRGVENLTGRPRLIRMAEGYDREVAAGGDFWAVMLARYGLRLSVSDEELARIPRAGPVVVVANHPFGILDGLAMGRLLAMARGDFRILAHRVFQNAADLREIVLPVDFAGTAEALAVNLATRAAAQDHLCRGGCVAVFPGGTVSTSARAFGPALDPAWKTFTARMILRARPTVVPVYFDGQNSRLFQLVSRVHPTLRVALLIREFGRRVGGAVRVRVGQPVPQADLDALRGDARALMDRLRRASYALADPPLADPGYGRSFD